MKVFNYIKGLFDSFRKMFRRNKPTPADFRRKHKGVNMIGYAPKLPSTSRRKNKIFLKFIPMKSRFAGVSRTAKYGKS